MEKDSSNEIQLSEERIRGIGEAAYVLACVKELGIQDNDTEPQNLGMYDPGDKEKACEDPRTIKVEANGKEIPVLCPIEYHVDANQAFYKGERGYFFNWQDWQPEFEEQIASKISMLPINAWVALERKAEDSKADELLKKIITYSNRKIELLPKCCDKKTNNIQNVIFYYSEADRPDEEIPIFENVKLAYEGLKNTQKWQEFSINGVRFVSGEQIAPKIKEGTSTKLLEDLWAAYDETFNKLIKNHPSDQKIPRDFFDVITTSQNSRVVYAEEDGELVSALFITENLNDLPWLNVPYYSKLNTTGRTVFMPGIATRLDAKKGKAYSPRLIKAMSYLGQHVPAISAIATQCTIVSAQYVPRFTDRFTKGSMNSNMHEIAKYEYPVYRIVS
jgi:hypothetical protein